MPGPCSPIEFSMPLGVSAIRGVGRPDRGLSMTDLVTIAPILDTSMNWASSRPAPAHPDAVMIGLGSSTWPSLVRRSTGMSLPPAAAPCRPGPCPALAVTAAGCAGRCCRVRERPRSGLAGLTG